LPERSASDNPVASNENDTETNVIFRYRKTGLRGREYQGGGLPAFPFVIGEGTESSPRGEESFFCQQSDLGFKLSAYGNKIILLKHRFDHPFLFFS
jgi:hypothetical protein